MIMKANVSHIKMEFDVKSLVEELANAEPAQVQQLKDLIETMLQAAHTNVDKLELDSTNANDVYGTAVETYNAAVSTFDGAQGNLNNALVFKHDAELKKSIAEGAKIEAKKNLDAVKPSLLDEIETLEGMLTLYSKLNTPNQALLDQIQVMLVAVRTTLATLELEYTNANNAYDTAVGVYNGAVSALSVAQDAFNVAQQAKDIAQQAKDIAQGAKDEAQHNLDTGKPSLEVEISNLDEMLRIHASLNKAGYGWTGCHVDDGNRDFDEGPHAYGYTIQTCFEACNLLETEITYFALQHNGWCCCANHAPTYQKVDDGECGGPCAGETTTLSVDIQHCGAGWRNAVYSLDSAMDWLCYYNRYVDLQKALPRTEAAMNTHWFNHGKGENRIWDC